MRPGTAPTPLAPRAPRTAADAVARADAKERIRTARWIRQGGIVMLGFGGLMLTRWSTWSPYTQAVRVRIHGGSSFTLSLAAVIGAFAVVLGPFVVLAGQWMLGRAVHAAERNPVTADIHEEDVED